jgi:hypothetical protein
MKARLFKYIIRSQKDDYERLGWYVKPIYSRGDTGLAFLAVWLCDCREVYPCDENRPNRPAN